VVPEERPLGHAGDGTITTVEGNTGNGKVEQRIRPTSQVVGYGYPQYSA
jgi:hypothetical protein